MKQIKISVIIANYNGIKYISDCLSSVSKSKYPNFEVLIVEDGSTDGSEKIIANYAKKYKFRVLQNQTNLGLVKSRNKAINEAIGDILVFLDNDTQVDKEWLIGIVDIFKDPKVGAAQCKIFDYHNRKVIQEVGMKIIPYTGFGHTLGRGEVDHAQYDRSLSIIALGAGVAVRKKVAVDIGGFDEKLYHYTDDLDFSWRIWIAGYKVILAPHAIIYHYTKNHPNSYHLYLHLSKNSLRMILKNYEILNVIKLLPCALLFNILGGCFVLITRLEISALLGVLIGFLWSIIMLPDTIIIRNRIQQNRKVSDNYIFSNVMTTMNLFSLIQSRLVGIKQNKELLKK